MLRRNDVFAHKTRMFVVTMPMYAFSVARPIEGGAPRLVCTYGLKKDQFLTSALRVINSQPSSSRA